ncbi:helix-turn-helix transcriptional regulator [Pedobacter sp. MC2016-24]|nr:helix-turn-helix transcriptional regulator [Pedobacter sp. MC2016-24]
MKSQALVLKIKILRKQHRISQATIAEKLGIAQNAFSKIELGKSDLTVARLYKIAEILKFDLLEVLRSI